MADRIADHAVDAGAAIEFMGAIEMFQVVQANLAGSGGFTDGGVFESAAVLRARMRAGKPTSPIGTATKLGAGGPFEEADAVSDGCARARQS